MGFFKTAKPKQFDYKPRYYDKKKEELEKKKREAENAGDVNVEFLRTEINRKWRFVDRKVSTRSKQVQILFYLLLLGILAFFIFFT